MPRLLSCGVIVRRASGELLLCHATGRDYWDIPKGLRGNGETSIAAALRELREEAGLVIPDDRLHDLGVHLYLSRKDLHVFALEPPDPALCIDSCRCTSYFTPRYGGRPVPEVDAYRWAARKELSRLCGKNMMRVLLSLPW